MFVKLKSVISDCITEKDGVTACPARIGWCVGSLAYLVATLYQIKTHGVFDYVQFATGFGIIQACGGAAVKIKETTEQTTP